MPYLYHIMSKDFSPDSASGKMLHPLNRLKDLHPEIFEKHRAKYADRKHVQELYIPQLDCYWGDVIHFSAVAPEKILEVLKEFNQMRQFSYFEINPHLLDPKQTVVYTNRPREDMKIVTEDDFVAFDPSNVSQWDYIPSETFEYYRKKFAEGAQPKLFVFIPHILYKNSLDLRGLSLKTILDVTKK